MMNKFKVGELVQRVGRKMYGVILGVGGFPQDRYYHVFFSEYDQPYSFCQEELQKAGDDKNA
jgi:hypothetical protein